MDFILALLMWQPFGPVDFSSQSLPSLMVQASGAPVTTARQWQLRRESIKFQLQYLAYGFLPAKNPSLQINVLRESPLESGVGSYRDVRLQFPTLKKEIKLAVFISNKNQKRSKTYLVLNKCGNHTVLKDFVIAESGMEWGHSVHCYKKGQRVPRGAMAEEYAVLQTLARGHNVVTWAESDVAADSRFHQDVGIKGAMEPTSSDVRRTWGVLMAWAWGFMRAMDYIETAKDLNPRTVVALGHSRRGKAALLAAAFDERIPAVVPHQSGTGGTALMRGSERRETPKMITGGWFFYPLMNEPGGLRHFFSPIFDEISEEVNELPFDSHFLISLVAPRLLLDFQGKDDAWAGPTSATAALAAAKPAWELTGHEKNLTQAIVSGGHRLTALHWQLIMDIIDIHMPTGKTAN